MNDSLKEIIDKIYFNKEYEYLKDKCKVEIHLPKEIEFTAKLLNLNIIEYLGEVIPAKKWTFKYPEVIKGEFEASFSTTLLISKIAPFYYMQHEFEVENKDENKLAPTLDGFDGQPYIRSQYVFQEQVNEVLGNKRYFKLSYAEITEVISELSFSEGVTIFGSQVTVEHAIFHDLLGLCNE